jgi:hypothetical protein
MLLHVCKVCSSSRVMCFLFRLPGRELNPEPEFLNF